MEDTSESPEKALFSYHLHVLVWKTFSLVTGTCWELTPYVASQKELRSSKSIPFRQRPEEAYVPIHCSLPGDGVTWRPDFPLASSRAETSTGYSKWKFMNDCSTGFLSFSISGSWNESMHKLLKSWFLVCFWDNPHKIKLYHSIRFW